MAEALLSRLVRLNAMHPPRAQLARTTAVAARPQQQLPLRGFTPGFDRKRAAAGDRDD